MKIESIDSDGYVTLPDAPGLGVESIGAPSSRCRLADCAVPRAVGDRVGFRYALNGASGQRSCAIDPGGVPEERDAEQFTAGR
jgi:hypothetical protein